MADAKQVWHHRSHLEIQRAQQRDKLDVAVWKRGQPDNQDNQAYPEKFLLHMYIGRYCVVNIYIYIATIHLLNSAC